MRVELPLAQSGQAAHEGNLNVVLTVYPERKRNQELESRRSLKKEKQKWQGKNKVAKPAVYETIQKKGQGWTSGAEALSCARDHKAEASFQTRGEKLSQHAPGLTNSMSTNWSARKLSSSVTEDSDSAILPVLLTARVTKEACGKGQVTFLFWALGFSCTKWGDKANLISS